MPVRHSSRTQPYPTLVAEGVARVAVGRGPLASNVYFVGCGASWTLVDAGWAHRSSLIAAAARDLFGDSAPAAIVLTHIHPDHSGSALELAERWSLPVHVHPLELPFAAGRYLPESANPLDRWLIAPLLRVLPQGPPSRLAEVARGFDPADGALGLDDWQCLHTPGHTPGHIVFFRPRDRVLLSGDALLTIDTNSLRGGPPMRVLPETRPSSELQEFARRFCGGVPSWVLVED